MEDRSEEEREEREDYLTELFNFAFILRGHVKDLEAVKEYVITEYVEKGILKMIKPTYSKDRLYILSEGQVKKYKD
ncbi:MAG: hypothetical protein HXS42_15765 [Theionarchaea archaeon]|nr:hypothetical protein [Theionarchaea archaeon]